MGASGAVPTVRSHHVRVRSDHHQQTASRRESLLAALAPIVLTFAVPRAGAAAPADDAAPDVFAARAASVVAVCSQPSGPGAQEAIVIASGVVWDTAGHIVTAYSPVNASLRQQQSVQIAIADDGGATLYSATVVAREPSLDLIVLKVQLLPGEADILRPVQVAASGALRVGQSLFLVGSTERGARTLTAGVLSATGRTLPAPNGQQIRGALQTDADLTALGLGGALLDSGGSLVGVPTTTYSLAGAGRSSGVNFAVPSDVLLAAVPKLIAYGNVAGRR